MRKSNLFFLIAPALILMAVIGAWAQADLIEAAQSGDLETVTKLLGTNPKLIWAKNAEGDTALHAAAGCRRGEQAALPIVRLLLEKGAVLEAKNSSGQTPILYAAYAGFRQVVELLISRGATVRYQDTNGRSPVHYAAREGHPEVVETLLKNGADPSLKDNQGQTPLELAVLRGRTAVVETLMKIVKFDIRSPEGSMILHAAASQGNEALAKTLLEQGADPNRPSPNGDTILISYLRGGLAARAAESIAQGADVKAKDASGRTALHLAVEKGLDKIVVALLAGGADPNAADQNGMTPLDIALDWGSQSLAVLLTDKGARPSPPKVHLLKGGSFEIAEPRVGTESVSIRYLGNEGFLVEAGSKSVLVDGLVRNPWGYVNTPDRALEMMKARRAPFGRIDLLLFSHAHRDHFEPAMAHDVLAAHPQSVLVGDRLVSDELRDAQPEAFQTLASRIKTVPIKLGERTELAANGVPLTILGVNHGSADRPYLTLGYIMELGGFRIYHQGDMYPDANMPFLAAIPWEEMAIDIAFLDPFFFQNEEAKRIALERIKPSAVILMHMKDSEVDRYFRLLRPDVPQVVVFQRPMEHKVFVKPARTVFEAAKKGDIPVLKAILAANPSLLNVPGEGGRSPLQEALLARQGEAARYLIEAGADVNWRDAEGIAPLGFAAFLGDTSLAAMLIARGADINARDSIMGGTSLHIAAMGGRADLVRLLIDKGAALETRSLDGRTPLAFAAERGKRDCAEILLSRGAAVDERDEMGRTLLHRAVLAADAEMVKLLLAKNADPSARSAYGNSALDLAGQEGLIEIAGLLSAGKPPAPIFPSLAGPYLGQPVPELSLRMFAPGIVSTERDELNAVFTPDGKEFYFTVRGASGRWTIMMMSIKNGNWSRPRPASFSGKWSDVDLFITADGRRLYFCSNRPLDGQGDKAKDFDIWMSERTAGDWSEPKNLGAPVNSPSDEFYPSLTKDGTLYFQSRRSGGPGAPDIWWARPAEGGFVDAKCLPPPVNSPGFEGDTLIAPDGSWLIVSTSRDPKAPQADLFLSQRTPDGTWAPLVKLEFGVSSPRSGENCQMLSPDGRYLFFTRDGDIYWVDASVIDQTKKK